MLVITDEQKRLLDDKQLETLEKTYAAINKKQAKAESMINRAKAKKEKAQKETIAELVNNLESIVGILDKTKANEICQIVNKYYTSNVTTTSTNV